MTAELLFMVLLYEATRGLTLQSGHRKHHPAYRQLKGAHRRILPPVSGSSRCSAESAVFVAVVGPPFVGRRGGSYTVRVARCVRSSVLPGLRTKDYRRNRSEKESKKVKAKKWNKENRRVVAHGCVCHVCVSRGLCLVATTDLLEEGAVSRYLGEFGEVLA